MKFLKVKRSILVISLIALFIGCLYKMNQHFDELARYPGELSEEEREIVLAHLNTEEINYLVTQKIEPQQFLPYIECDGFVLANTLWYDAAYNTQKEDVSYIVSFINRYRNNMVYSELKDLLSNYTYNVLTRFFDEGDAYDENAYLIANPKDPYVLVSGNATLYLYEPKDLVSINSLAHENITGSSDITIKQEVVEPLMQLCKAASEINGKKMGDMHLVAGYISYEDQIEVYERVVKEYGDSASLYFDTPGKNEYQLGYTITLQPNEQDTSNDKENDKDKNEQPSEEEMEQAIWLKDNAYKYGFIIRYPKGKESITHKTYQPYTLRYVGKDLAKYIHDNNIAIEEVNLDDFRE